jgi:Tol biopolymer transport system component
MTTARLRAVLAVAVLVTACVCASVAFASSASSPPPGRIVYSGIAESVNPFRYYSLFIAAADGTGARRITFDALGSDVQPRWSPDGKQVAFTRLAPDNTTSVWVVNADGTNPHIVSGGHRHAEHPKWSPDGRWITFQEQRYFNAEGVAYDSSYELWIVHPDGSDMESLYVSATFQDFDESVKPVIRYGQAWAWSPDSKQIAFVYTQGYDDRKPRIGILNVDTRSRRELTTGSYPAWSPDGTQVAVVDRCRIWLTPPKGGKRTAITPRPAGCLVSPAWSPDGRWIAADHTYAPVVLPLVTRFDGKRQNTARPIPPAAVRWPRDCKRLFFYRKPRNDGTTNQVGWVVHGPQGLPRFVRAPEPHVNVQSNLDWRC